MNLITPSPFDSDSLRDSPSDVIETFNEHATVFRIGKKVIIGLASNICFTVPSPSIESFRRLNDTRLAYELESLLPMDAEDMAIGKTDEIVVVTNSSIVQSLIDDEEGKGIWIGGISPLIFLAVEGWLQSCKNHHVTVPKNFDLIWTSEETKLHDHILIQDGSPVAWNILGEAELARKLSSILQKLSKQTTRNDPSMPRITEVTGTSLESGLVVLGKAALRAYETANDMQTNIICQKCASQTHYASDYVQRLLDGHASPWVDFRGKSLNTHAPHAPIYPSIAYASAAVMVLLACLFATVVWDCVAITTRTAQSQTTQEESFHKLFPNQPIPTDIVGRFRSEHRKLTQGLSEIEKTPPISSSLPILVRFLETLPEDSVFRIDGIRVQSSEILAVDGAVKVLNDFEKIVSTLRSKGFRFATPNIQQMVDGFSLRLERVSFVSPAITNNSPTLEPPRQLSTTEIRLSNN